MVATQDPVRALRGEIAKIISTAEAQGQIVSSERHAALLFAQFPDLGWSVGRIVEEIITAASTHQVAVEISREKRTATGS